MKSYINNPKDNMRKPNTRTKAAQRRRQQRVVSQRRTSTVMAGVHWDEILKAVEEATMRDGAEYFSEWDAKQLEAAANRIRAKLATPRSPTRLETAHEYTERPN